MKNLALSQVLFRPNLSEQSRAFALTSSFNPIDLRMPDAHFDVEVEALRFWLKLGFISFGGRTGQIAIMHAEYIGWLLHKTPGGIATGALFVLPSVFILWG